MTTPSIRLLKESFPEANLTFLTETPSDQVLRENSFLDEIVLFHKSKSIYQSFSFLQKIRKRRFDCVIDLICLCGIFNANYRWLSIIIYARRTLLFHKRERTKSQRSLKVHMWKTHRWVNTSGWCRLTWTHCIHIWLCSTTYRLKLSYHKIR